MRVAVFRRRPVPHGTWRPFNRFSSAAILFVVTDVFPTTVSAGRLLAKRCLGASAILRQLAVITIHWRCLCSARGNGYIREDLEYRATAPHPLRGRCADATKRINDCRLSEHAPSEITDRHRGVCPMSAGVSHDPAHWHK